mmetsp:Transcript_3954/g.11492  ORF Transcript_3954/g.11492 Transcript_3954/m.11492 type:complete len:461 (-) Transcript_3954:215-1597(-)
MPPALVVEVAWAPAREPPRRAHGPPEAWNNVAPGACVTEGLRDVQTSSGHEAVLHLHLLLVGVTWPGPPPKFRRVVVTAAREDVPHWVPRQPANGGLMPVSHVCLRHRVWNQPVKYRAVVPTADKEVLVNGVPADACDVPVLSLVRLELLHHPDVEDLQDLVPAPAENPVPVPVPLTAHHGALVPVQVGQTLARLRIPQFDHAILAAGRNEGLPGVPTHALYVSSVARELVLDLTLGKVPDLHGGVIGRRGKLGVRRREGQVPNGLAVGVRDLPGLVQRRRPVLDPAPVVPRNKPVLAVTVLHAPNSILVRLDDRLEVEAHAVPQRELATLAAGQEAPSSRGPHQSVHRALDFVGAHVHKLGVEIACGRLAVGLGRKHVQGARGHWFQQRALLLELATLVLEHLLDHSSRVVQNPPVHCPVQTVVQPFRLPRHMRPRHHLVRVVVAVLHEGTLLHRGSSS